MADASKQFEHKRTQLRGQRRKSAAASRRSHDQCVAREERGSDHPLELTKWEDYHAHPAAISIARTQLEANHLATQGEVDHRRVYAHHGVISCPPPGNSSNPREATQGSQATNHSCRENIRRDELEKAEDAYSSHPTSRGAPRLCSREDTNNGTHGCSQTPMGTCSITPHPTGADQGPTSAPGVISPGNCKH